MSLKDRLNLNNSQDTTKDTSYIANSHYAKSGSLGALDTLLADDEINRIFINGAKNVFIQKKDKINKINLGYGDDFELENILKIFSKNKNIKFDYENP